MNNIKLSLVSVKCINAGLLSLYPLLNKIKEIKSENNKIYVETTKEDLCDVMTMIQLATDRRIIFSHYPLNEFSLMIYDDFMKV